MAVFPSLYHAKAVQVNGSGVRAFVPQVFGDQAINVTRCVGTFPSEPGMGWVSFQGGNPSFPVWMGFGAVVANGGGGGGGGGGGTDEVWIGPSEPTGPQELWYDTDEELPVVPLMTVKGMYFGTATPLPNAPTVNDLWTIGSPVPTAAPARGDGTGAAQIGDAVTWNGTTWVNVGLLGTPGPPGVPQRQTVVAKGTLSAYTLALTDEDRILWWTANLSITLTIPLNSVVPFAVGARVDIAQTGNGKITVVPTGGVTLYATPSAVLRYTGSAASLIQLNTNVWLLSGDLT